MKSYSDEIPGKGVLLVATRLEKKINIVLILVIISVLLNIGLNIFNILGVLVP